MPPLLRSCQERCGASPDNIWQEEEDYAGMGGLRRRKRRNGRRRRVRRRTRMAGRMSGTCWQAGSGRADEERR
eukprot:1921432-Pyramimonas_sp.AAC.1